MTDVEAKVNVSVCMAVYNGEYYLSEQIDSILNQLQPNDELIICDDKSTDKTKEIVLKYTNDIRVRFYQNSNRLGVIKNFEKALNKAKGDFIFFCDQDDIWLPNKIDVCIRKLQTNILVLSDCIVIDNARSVVYKSFYAINKSQKGFWRNLFKNSYMGCCIAFRKELLSCALPIPKNIPMHDVWFGLLAEIKGSVCFYHEPLVLYRRHGNNVSFLKSTTTLLKKITGRINLIINIVFRLILCRCKKN